MNYTNLLFSKIADENQASALSRYNITADQLSTAGERETLGFILDYARTNGGNAPSYATLANECPTFDYTPQVSDSYEFLAREIKKHSAQQKFLKYANDTLGQKFREEAGEDIYGFLDGLIADIEGIKQSSKVRTKVGIDVVTDSGAFLDEYEKRKRGESSKMWRSKFRVIPDYVGGNIYVFYGKSGRGKSVIASIVEAVELAMQGANVLIWSMEMPWFEVLVRLYVELSGRMGIVTANVHGIDMAAGFDSGELRTGRLDDDFEGAFRTFVSTLNEQIPGSITVRAVDDEDFHDRSVSALEADILETNADLVVVDPFYYLDYEKNTSKTTGGDAAATSMRLRKLAGKTKAVFFAITQADETDAEEDDEGNRELEIPKRKDVAKTKSLLQDASLLIGIDTDYKQGRGIIGLNKGRDGGEGTSAEILYIPQVGIVKQPDFEVAAHQFM